MIGGRKSGVNSPKTGDEPLPGLARSKGPLKPPGALKRLEALGMNVVPDEPID